MYPRKIFIVNFSLRFFLLYDNKKEGSIAMFHVYTQKKGAELTKTHVKDFKDLEVAFECAEKSIEGKEDFKYIIEETSGHFNSYGELLVDVVAESD